MTVHIPKFVPVAPSWASTFGVDRWGVFAGITISDTTQMLRWIEPGKFMMGSPEGEIGRWSAEGPEHEVRISRGFWIGETPVTQDFYEAVTRTNPSNFKGEGTRPVEKVSWQDATACCEELTGLLAEFCDTSARLPTEAEWEYACRAGSTASLYIKEPLTSEMGTCPNLDKIAWYDENSNGTTHPVGEKLPNNWGLYDMLGNVWEWCQDVWHDNYDEAPVDGSARSGDGSDRVYRGGSWSYFARSCRCAYRRRWHSGVRDYDLGFRLVLAPKFHEDKRPFS